MFRAAPSPIACPVFSCIGLTEGLRWHGDAWGPPAHSCLCDVHEASRCSCIPGTTIPAVLDVLFRCVWTYGLGSNVMLQERGLVPMERVLVCWELSLAVVVAAW